LTALLACSPFGAEETSVPPADAGPGPADAASSDAPSDAGAPATFAGCASGAFLFCETFDGPFVLASTDWLEGGGTLTQTPTPPATASGALRAFLPASASTTQLRVSIDRNISPSVKRVIVDADVYVASAPQVSDGEMGILGLFAGGDPLFTAVVFVRADGDLSLSTQTLGFKAVHAAGAFPVGQWRSLRLEADHLTATYRVLVAPRGEPLRPVIDLTPAKSAEPATPLRILAGIQRYNDGTPALEVFYDHVVVSEVK
jgi:hypothetical protein